MGPRVVIVTGASSGIGRATAHALARCGDALVLVARALGPLEDVAGECTVLGARSVEVRSVDVGSFQQVQDAVEQVLAAHGRLDAVVHCAGVVAYGRFEEVPVEVFDGVLRTNLLGSANVARAALRSMRARDAGTLVLIGSLIGEIGAPSMTAYAVSKWGLRALARRLQLENRDRPGVHVSCVSPGSVDTPIYRQAANYQGRVGRPPPPVVSPERVARKVVDVLDRPRKRAGVGSANVVLRLGFALTPGLFDALVGPLFRLAATGRDAVPMGSGNVLAPNPELNQLHSADP